MTFVAKAPTRSTAAAVLAMPRPGTRRPSKRSYIGVVRPSTTPKIQISAATLMKSGTVTKKPAMKLRRSHCIENSPTLKGRATRRAGLSGPPQPDHRRRRQRETIPGKRIERMLRQVADEVFHRRVPDHRRTDDPDEEQGSFTGGRRNRLHRLRRLVDGRTENRGNGQEEDE